MKINTVARTKLGVYNGFMVLDTINVFINDDTSIYVVGNSSVSNDNDSVIWHARLGHIGQDFLKRLA